MSKTINNLPDEIRDLVREISEEEVLKLRLEGKKRIIFKVDGKIYIMRDKKAISSCKYVFGRHLCSSCMFLNEGHLCPKIADLSKDTWGKYKIISTDTLIESKRIEKYEFITRGVEGFNFSKEFLVVAVCSRYESNEEEIKKRAKANTAPERGY